MPKRDQTPPYEIMRSRTPGQGTTPANGGEPVPTAPRPSDPADQAPAGGHVSPTRAPWWVGSSAPLVLRLPRGLAVLSVFGVLLVIVLAYWVGTMRGAASADPDGQGLELGDRLGPDGYFESDSKEDPGPAVKVPEGVISGTEKRQKGRWYIKLVDQANEASSRDLAKFMAGKGGVAIQLVRRDNGKFAVYVLTRSCTDKQRKGEAAKYYLENKIKPLYASWQNSKSGKASNLTDQVSKLTDIKYYRYQ